jgi:peptidylprolyl isomerase/FKBP-type peptidyl-prolyl cis-trans isomerase FklB
MKRAFLLVLALTGALAACGAKEKVADAGLLEANKAEAKAFLAKTAKEPGVRTTPSGLQYKIVRNGPATGMRPQEGDLIKVHYEGKLPDGTVFDSSYERGAPAAMPLDGLIPGWIEALKLMRPGDEWIIFLPPELGYGAEGAGKIPPNSALIFRIELIDMIPGPGRVQNG